MRLWSQSFDNGGRIPEANAFGKHDPATGQIALSENLSPHLAWADAPAGTKSFALVCHDPDVPSKPDDVNREGRVVPASLPRVDFTHWILLDIPASKRELAEGELSKGITPRGKSGPDAPDGMRQGINDYTGWFAGDADMSGTYFGYDGPCPPWNDEIVHHYHFTLHALDVEKLAVSGELTRDNVLRAIEPHTLGRVSIVGTYAINPNAK